MLGVKNARGGRDVREVGPSDAAIAGRRGGRPAAIGGRATVTRRREYRPARVGTGQWGSVL